LKGREKNFFEKKFFSLPFTPPTFQKTLYGFN